MSKHLLVKVSGSIATFKTATIVSHFVKAGWKVRVAMTESAQKFVGSATFEGLSGEEVLTDLWHQGRAMDHIHLDRWADIVLLCPASANTLNKMANGHADNLITNLFLAHDFATPYFIAPAMNTKMWSHPSTKEAIDKLFQMGARILMPDSGSLACGEVGEGRLLEPEKIIEAIEKFEPKEQKVLVTLGGTEEPIDGVRYLSNTSTGSTGRAICQELSQQGYQVTAIASRRVEAVTSQKRLSYTSADDLESALKSELENNDYFAVIHAAAISDFRIDPQEGKMNSDEELSLRFKPREKTIGKIKNWSKNKNIKLVGFKLTSGASEGEQKQAVDKVLEFSDAVMANDTATINDSQHAFQLFNRAGLIEQGDGKVHLAKSIASWLTKEAQS